MQVCTSLQADNHASTPPLSFLQAGWPSCRPTNSVKALQKRALKEQSITKYKQINDSGQQISGTEPSVPESDGTS